MTIEPVVEEISDSMMGKAKNVAKLSPQNFKVGAVITKRGKVVAKGYNSYKTHPVWGNPVRGYHYMHAECNAIYDAKKRGVDLKGATVHVYRKGHNNSKPCSHCHEKLMLEGVALVRYSK